MQTQSRDMGVKSKCLHTTSPSTPLLSAALDDLVTVPRIHTESNKVGNSPPKNVIACAE